MGPDLAVLQPTESTVGEHEAALLGEAHRRRRGGDGRRDLIRLGGPRREHQPSATGVGDKRVERLVEGREQRPGRLDGQFPLPVHAAVGGQRAEHVLRVGGEELVHEQRLATVVDRSRHRRRPPTAPAIVAVPTATQHEQVAHDLCAGRAHEGASREAEGTDQVGSGFDLAAGSRVAGIGGVAGGEHRHQPARPGQLQALDDEVVVQSQPGAVVAGVVRGDLGEGDVADHQVEVPVRRDEGLEALGTDRCPGAVEMAGDRGGGGVGLHAGDLAAVGRQADEVARPASRLQHPPAGEAQVRDRPPHGGDHLGGRVVGVERGPPGRRPCHLVAEEPASLLPGHGVGVVGLVEDLREAAPARPTSEHRLLLGRRVPPLGAQAVEDLQRRQIGLQLGGGPARCQVGLAPGPERYGRFGSSAGTSVQSRSADASARETIASCER